MSSLPGPSAKLAILFPKTPLGDGVFIAKIRNSGNRIAYQSACGSGRRVLQTERRRLNDETRANRPARNATRPALLLFADADAAPFGVEAQGGTRRSASSASVRARAAGAPACSRAWFRAGGGTDQRRRPSS